MTRLLLSLGCLFIFSLYAPGFYTGYGVKTLPGVREAIEQDDWGEAREQIQIQAGTLNAFGEHLDKMIEIISNSN